MTPPRLQVSPHPLVQHHLGHLRDISTPPVEFRALVKRLATLLAAEATRDLELSDSMATTPLAVTKTKVLAQRIALVPILRAGLGLVEPFLELMPSAEVWHLGVYRNEATAQPVEYYQKLPQSDPVDIAFVVDPMLATGGSATHTLALLKRWGVRRLKLVSLIAAPEGISAVSHAWPDVDIIVGAVDECLNDRKFIVPGLGDAGDRQFNSTHR